MGFLKYSVFVFIICAVSSSPVQVNELSKGMTEFARDLYLQCVQTEPGNVIVSPLSVANALGLLTQGTSGKTFDELKTALHLSYDKSVTANQFLEHRENLEKSAGDATLSIANQVFVQQGQKLSKKFQDVAVSKFKSGVESLNFADSDKSAGIINDFVEEKTSGKIKDLIKPNMLTSDTRSVLVNAIYFKGIWEKQFFTSEFSRKGDFYISETEKQSIDFMSNFESFNHVYHKELGAEVLEMKYANSNMSFVIILPETRMGLASLESKLKDYDLTKITENMESRMFALRVPKFKVEYEINLNNALQNMGITDIFSSTADLKGILESGESLSISQIVHKAFIEIDEKGTEAAAATAGAMVAISLPPPFEVDHPFMYLIRDAETNTIVFSGRIEKF